MRSQARVFETPSRLPRYTLMKQRYKGVPVPTIKELANALSSIRIATEDDLVQPAKRTPESKHSQKGDQLHRWVR